MTSQMKTILGVVIAIAIIAGGVFAFRQHGAETAQHPVVVQPSTPRTAPTAAAPPAVMPPGGPSAAGANTPAPIDCVLPAPAPAVPDGATATADQMHAGHDVIQNFVLKLEAFQTCRNAQIDHASPLVTEQAKQSWEDQGNDAVDQANALAAAFAGQVKIFHARPGQ